MLVVGCWLWLLLLVLLLFLLLLLLHLLYFLLYFWLLPNLPAKQICQPKGFLKQYKAYTSAKVKTIEVVPCPASIQQGHCELEDFRLAFPMESMESRFLGEFGCTDDGSFSGCFAHFAQSWNSQDL